MEQRTPAGRAGRPADIAGLIAFLASPDAEFMTGSYLIMDGGLRDARGFNLPNVDAANERQRHAEAAIARRARLQPLIDER